MHEFASFVSTASKNRLPGFWVYDGKEKSFLFDKRAAALLGKSSCITSAQEVLRQDGGDFYKFLKDILETQELGDFIITHLSLRQDNLEKCLYVQGSVLFRNKHGEALYAAGFLTEVTNPFSSLVMQEASGDGAWEWNAITGTTRFSNAYMTMLGYESAQGFPKDFGAWVQLVHPEDLKAVEMQVQLCADPSLGDTFECCLRLRHKDGHYIWTLGKGYVVQRNAGGQALRLIGTNTNIEIFKKYNEFAFEKMFEDALTGVRNREYFHSRLPNVLRRSSYPVSLIYLDITGLKMTNDIAGHRYGDDLLTTTVGIIRQCIEKNERRHCIRMGGDEFLIVLPECSALQVREYARSIRTIAAAYNDNAPLPVLFGLGTATFSDYDDFSQAFHTAERLMQEDKRQTGPAARRQMQTQLEKLLGKKISFVDHRIPE